MRCTYCGHKNPQEEPYCDECGMKLEGVTPPRPSKEGKIRCDQCGVMNDAGESVCRNCNQPLESVSEPLVDACSVCGFTKNPPSAKFCMNCGSEIAAKPPSEEPIVQPVAKLVLSPDAEIVISEVEKTLGRADFFNYLPEKEVQFISREHFTIRFDQGKYYIKDENSVNGTKLNGVELKNGDAEELNNDDEIEVAATVGLKFQVGANS